MIGLPGATGGSNLYLQCSLIIEDIESGGVSFEQKISGANFEPGCCFCRYAAASGCKSEALKIGASPVPHAEILEFAEPLLKKEGIEIEIIEFSDYVQPNLQLADKQIDANFFQHIPYLESFAAERELDITWVARIHIEPMGIYSEKLTWKMVRK